MKIAFEIMRWFCVIVWIGWLIAVLCGYPLDQFMSALAIIFAILYCLAVERD